LRFILHETLPTCLLPRQRSLDWFIKTISLQDKADLDNLLIQIAPQYTRDEIIRLIVSSRLYWADASLSLIKIDDSITQRLDYVYDQVGQQPRSRTQLHFYIARGVNLS
jgi:hypothetical protein